jgi:hypothetical protein
MQVYCILCVVKQMLPPYGLEPCESLATLDLSCLVVVCVDEQCELCFQYRNYGMSGCRMTDEL